MLSLKDISLQKGERNILDHVNLTIKSAEMHSILGMNGTGKNILAYAIMGLLEYQIQSGQILFDNHNITKLDMTERACLGITLAWQEPARFEGITVYDYLRLAQPSKKKKFYSGIVCKKRGFIKNATCFVN